MKANRHIRSNADLILKCDIEGDEWEIFATLQAALLRRFRQIVVEIRGLRDLCDPGFATLAAGRYAG